MKLVRKNSVSPSPALSPRPRPAADRQASRRVVAPRPQPSANPLPRPRRAGVSKGLVAAALLALLAVAAAGYWATRDEALRDSLRQDIGTFLRRSTQGTPLEGMIAGLLPAESPLPTDSAASVVPGQPELPFIPSSEDGFLAGQVISAPVTPPPPASETPPVPPQLRSDDRVTPVFVTDLARFFVAQHGTKGGDGPLPLSVQRLNQHYGSRLTGLTAGGADAQARRAALLRYAFHPAMLRALYDIYADRFMDAVIREAMHPARGQGLSEAQTRRLCLAVGGRLVLLAGALDGVRRTPDMRGLLTAVDARAQEAQTAMERMQEQMLRVDDMQARGGDAVAVARARIVVDKEAAAYRAALQGRDEARRAIAAAIRRAGGQGFDDATLIYLAEWVDRRLRADAEAGETVGVAAQLLRDLGRRFAQAGTQGLPEPLEQRLAREQREAAEAAAAQAASRALQETTQDSVAPVNTPLPAAPALQMPGDAGPVTGVSTPPPVASSPREHLLSRPPVMPSGGSLTPPSPPVAPSGGARP